ncbi:hypothetical protein STEG23_017745, partial [Scotinomys teguina]
CKDVNKVAYCPLVLKFKFCSRAYFRQMCYTRYFTVERVLNNQLILEGVFYDEAIRSGVTRVRAQVFHEKGGQIGE